MMYWGGGGPGAGWGIFMSVVMLAFWGGIIGLLVYAVRQIVQGHPEHRNSVDPKQILAERLARGEINEDEYRSRLELLTSNR